MAQMDVSGAEAGATGGFSGGGDGGGVQDSVKDAAGQAAEKGKEAVGQVAGQARGTLRSQVDQRSTTAGEQITSQASDIRSVAEQLREQGKDGPAKVAEQAAERVDRVGSYLRDSDADRLLSDVEDFARRNPWAVVAVGAVAGFAASRMLKASSSDRYHGVSRPRPASAWRPYTSTGAQGISGDALATGAVGSGYGTAGAYAPAGAGTATPAVGSEPEPGSGTPALTGVAAESGTDPQPGGASVSASLEGVAAEPQTEPPGSTGGYGAVRPEDPARGTV